MKCTKCGYEHKDDVQANVKHIAFKINELGHLVSDDIELISKELQLSDRQVKKYISLINNYGEEDLLKKISLGQSINSLTNTLSKKKTVLIQVHKLLQKEYDINYSDLRELLKNYKK